MPEQSGGHWRTSVSSRLIIDDQIEIAKGGVKKKGYKSFFIMRQTVHCMNSMRSSRCGGESSSRVLDEPHWHHGSRIPYCENQTELASRSCVCNISERAPPANSPFFEEKDESGD